MKADEAKKSLTTRIVVRFLLWSLAIYFVSMIVVSVAIGIFVRQAAQSEADQVISFLDNLGTPLFYNDGATMGDVTNYLRANSNIEFVRYYRAKGPRLLGEYSKESVSTVPTLTLDDTNSFEHDKSLDHLFPTPFSIGLGRYTRVISPVRVRSLVADDMFNVGGGAPEEKVEVIGYIDAGLSLEKPRRVFYQTIMGSTIALALLVLVAAIVGRRQIRNAMKPLFQLEEPLRKLATGDFSVRVESSANYREIAAIESALYTTIAGLKQREYELQQEYQRRETTLAEKLKAEAASQAKSRFLANMSHEIRTPLTAIIGFSESMLDGDQTMEERVEAIHTVIRTGRHLLNIINDILDLSKIEAGKLDIEKIDVSPIAVVNEIRSIVLLQTQEKGLQFNVQYDFPLPQTIQTDQHRLKQILINLIGNAAKFTKEGGISLKVRCLCDQNLLVFDVIDTGIGLTAEQKEKLFNPFSQADSSTTRKYGGTGLGLHLSKLLAEKLGGTIHIESEYGKGSCFSVSIATGPVDSLKFINSETEIPKANDVVAASNEISVKGRILLAEDVVDNQRLISLFARKLGADIEIAENGKEALEKASSDNFDLIFMDMQMPVMDGLEATRRLRELGYSKPIVALTANTMKEDVDRCYQAGCDDVLAKPVNRAQFQDTIIRYLLTDEADSADDSPVTSVLLFEDPDVADLVHQFVDELPQRVSLIEKCLQQKDWDKIRRQAYDIKGQGGSFGYPELTKIAAKLEFESLSRNFEKTKRVFGHLKQMITRIKLGLKKS